MNKTICRCCRETHPLKARNLCSRCYDKMRAKRSLTSYPTVLHTDEDPNDQLPIDYRIERAKRRAHEIATGGYTR